MDLRGTRERVQRYPIVFGLSTMCQAGLGQLDPKRDHRLEHRHPGMGQSRFGRFLDPGRTWWISEVRGKGSTGIVFGLNAMCQTVLGQLCPKRDHGLAHGWAGTRQSGFGRFLWPGRTWWTSEVRQKGCSGIVFGLNAMCQAGLGNWTQNGTMVLPMGALERDKVGLVDF